MSATAFFSNDMTGELLAGCPLVPQILPKIADSKKRVGSDGS
jgi:hypothetical protein